MYDGGKIITGNGYFNGTVTFGWVIKLFGTVPCGSSSTTSVPTAYNLWTLPIAANATTSALCISQAAWIVTGAFAIGRSTLYIDATEDWKDGG